MITRLAGETDAAFVLRVEGVVRRPDETDTEYAFRLSGSGPPLDPWRLVIEGSGPALHVAEGAVSPILPARVAGETDDDYVGRVRTERSAFLVQGADEKDAAFAKREKAAKAKFSDANTIATKGLVDAPGDANILIGRFIDYLRARGHRVRSAMLYAGSTGENPGIDITDGDMANLRFYRSGDPMPPIPAGVKGAKKAQAKATKAEKVATAKAKKRK